MEAIILVFCVMSGLVISQPVIKVVNICGGLLIEISINIKMNKFKLITVKRVLILASIVICAIVYHTGVKAEKDCLSRGNSANQCAKLNSF